MHGYAGTHIPTIISNILRYILENVPAEQRPPNLEQWPIITDAAQQEGLLLQTAGDCNRYAFLIASCLASSLPIPISLLSPAVVANSRHTLMHWLLHRHVPPITNYYSPSATALASPLPPATLPVSNSSGIPTPTTSISAQPSRRRRRS